MERRANRTVLRFAIPTAILELLSEKPGDDTIDILMEIGAQHHDHPVNARLDLAAEEWLAAVLPSAMLPDLLYCLTYLLITGSDPKS